MPAVKDLCWCQSTAAALQPRARRTLSKICAGVNPQRAGNPGWPAHRCQRSVLVSIHSSSSGAHLKRKAVKDLCWCQSTATIALMRALIVLSKICAGVNPQLCEREVARQFGCQRSVLVSIHSGIGNQEILGKAVKDLCWCQSTAREISGKDKQRLSKICAGVNPQQNWTNTPPASRCQRSVLVSIHS